MKKLNLFIIAILFLTGCGPSAEKKVAFIKQSTKLMSKHVELCADVYSLKFFDRKTLDSRLKIFYEQTDKLESFDDWSVSDTVKMILREAYRFTIQNNLLFDSLQKVNRADGLTVGLLGLTSLEMDKRVQDLLKDEADKLSIQLNN